VENTCFFIGNRYAPDSIRGQLSQVVEKHITEYGVNVFVVGNYGNFDRMVQGVLLGLKLQYTDIELYMLAPYALTQKVDVPRGFDGTLYPENLEKTPLSLAIVQANRYMVQHADYLIIHPSAVGNSRRIFEYARKREKKGLIKITLI